MTALALSAASARLLARVSDRLRSLGSLAQGRRRSGIMHRTGAPVLRDSIEEGTFEDVFFAMPALSEPDGSLTASRRARNA